MHPNDLRQLADILEAGQFSPTDPRATFWARGVQGVQFSSQSVALPLLTPVPADVASDATFTRLLKVNTAGGAPRAWHVRAALTDNRAIVPLAPWWTQGLTCRVRWSIGQNEDTADIDFRSGVVCFPMTAESLEIMAQAALPPASAPAAWDVQVQAAVSPYPLPADWRAPTRTASLTLPPGIPPAGTGVNVPRHAQQLTLLANGTPSLAFVDSAAVVLANALLNAPGPLTVDIPAGTARVLVLTSPSPAVATTLAFVFRLGL